MLKAASEDNDNAIKFLSAVCSNYLLRDLSNRKQKEDIAIMMAKDASYAVVNNAADLFMDEHIKKLNAYGKILTIISDA